MGNKKSYVYILTNKSNKVLYIGVTSDIKGRIYKHKTKYYKGFTSKYCVDKLIYYEQHSSICEAIKREKLLKKWCREWKLDLVKGFNSEFCDLYELL